MATFLTKVFSRGKDKDKSKVKDAPKESTSSTTKQSKRTSRASVQSLLEGKFEAVSPSISPSVQKFEEKEKTIGKDKEKEKEKSALFRPKSRTTGSGVVRKSEDVPQLKLDLNLPSVKGDSHKRDLSVVYESATVLDDAALGEKRLSSAEALKLMRACSSVLGSRGLETLGVMHPHWHSASPATQRKIISLFLSSLDSPSPSSASAASPTSAASAFKSELEYARSPHDVAAVFRWALRHLKLDEDAFGKDGSPTLAWYDSFSEQEKEKSYPQTAYSELLLPVIKPSHAELLNSTLSLVSSLACHSETNSVSGSKLTMSLGQYLLTGNRVDDMEDWLSFYAHWERAGRALEHIFLASLRDEASKTGIPRRLSELVVNYPYAKHATDNQFPRPARFATRTYDALYIRITSELSSGFDAKDESRYPLRVLENAFNSDAGDGAESAETAALWEELKKLSSTTEETALDQPLSNVLSDETIRLLSLRPDGVDKGSTSITMFTTVPEHELFPWQNGSSTNGSVKGTTNGSASVSRNTSEGTKGETSPLSTDWNVFTSAGFGEISAGEALAATLMDNDLEKTDPPSLVPRRSLRKSRSPGRSDRTVRQRPVATSSKPRRYKTTLVSHVKLDESFIDFWSDALLDTVAYAWPAFVVCQLKSDVVRTFGDKKVTWLVIEQKLIAPPPPAEPASPVRRAGSPRPSVRSENESRAGIIGRVSSTFSSRKRLNFFGGQAVASGAPATVTSSEKWEIKTNKGAKVGEMGEVITEEGVASPSQVALPKVVPEKANGSSMEAIDKPSIVADTAAADALGTGAVAATAAVVENATSGANLPVVEEQTSVQTEEVKEQDVAAPIKDTESDSSQVAPVLEDKVVTVDTQPLPADLRAAEPATNMPKVADSAPQEVVSASIVDSIAPSEVVQSTKAVPEEVSKQVEPASTEPLEADALTLPSAPEAAEVPSASAESHVAETEGAAAGVHPGAGESRFVEHIETPPDDKTTDPLEEFQVENKQETLSSVAESSEPTVPQSVEVEAAPTAERAEMAEVIEVAVPVSEVPSVVKEHSAVATEKAETKPEPQLAEASPASPPEESAPFVEDVIVEEPAVAKVPAVEKPATEVLVAEEPVVEESGPEEAIIEGSDAPATDLVDDEAVALAEAEASTPVVEPTAPIVEQPASPAVEDTVVPEEEPSAADETAAPEEPTISVTEETDPEVSTSATEKKAGEIETPIIGVVPSDEVPVEESAVSVEADFGGKEEILDDSVAIPEEPTSVPLSNGVEGPVAENVVDLPIEESDFAQSIVTEKSDVIPEPETGDSTYKVSDVPLASVDESSAEIP